MLRWRRRKLLHYSLFYFTKFTAARCFRSCDLPVDHLLCGLAVTVALNFDLGGQRVEFGQVFRRQLYICGAEVLFETVDLRCSRDRNYPVFLSKHPCQRDLCRRGTFTVGESGNAVDERLIRLARLGGESRNAIAEIVRGELSILVDLACEKSFSERTERDESDPELFERGQDRLLGFAPPQRIFVLQCCKRLNGVCTANHLDASL